MLAKKDLMNFITGMTVRLHLLLLLWYTLYEGDFHVLENKLAKKE